MTGHIRDCPYFIDPRRSLKFDRGRELETTVLTGIHGERMMMVLNATRPGCSVALHSHPHEQIGVVYAGRGILRIGDEEREVEEGQFYLIPPYVPHGDRCLGDEPFVMLDVFAPVREDLLPPAEPARREEGPPHYKKIVTGGILVFPGVEELDFAGAYEVLAKASSIGTGGGAGEERAVRIALIAREKEVVCANGLIMRPHERYQGLDGLDFLIVPGGKGVEELRDDAELMGDLERFHRAGKLLCSVCTGTLVLAWAGVLKGARATTHHAHRDKLQRYCEVVEGRVVNAGNIITAGGVSSSIDLGLEILKHFFGAGLAREVARRIEYRWTG